MAEEIEVQDIKADTCDDKDVNDKPAEEPTFNEIIEKTEPEKTEPKKAKTVNPELKEKKPCPDCGKLLTNHGLKYTHAKYCKSKPKPSEVVQVPIQETKPVPPPPVEPPPPKPPGLVRPKSLLQPVTNERVTPTPDDIAAYLKNERMMKVMKRQAQFSSLVSGALP